MNDENITLPGVDIDNFIDEVIEMTGLKCDDINTVQPVVFMV
ncbi:hypothetical protein [Geovibrio ferrireducens]|jgi:hypothetical protein|nr:hypothetical protein [Geovibrio ferrireducens]